MRIMVTACFIAYNIDICETEEFLCSTSTSECILAILFRLHVLVALKHLVKASTKDVLRF